MVKNNPAYKMFLAATMLAGLWKSGPGGMCSIVLRDKVRKIFHLAAAESTSFHWRICAKTVGKGTVYLRGGTLYMPGNNAITHLAYP
jgi:hypothetical protein